MSAIESGVPDILFARFNLASAGLLCPASAWTGGGGASSATPCGCRRDDNGICDGGERCRRGALVYWCVRSAGWGRIRPCIPGRGCLGGAGWLMSVTGSCWRGAEAVSLCPGQICRVSGDGLKRKIPVGVGVYGDACIPGGERGDAADLRQSVIAQPIKEAREDHVVKTCGEITALWYADGQFFAMHAERETQAFPSFSSRTAI